MIPRRYKISILIDRKKSARLNVSLTFEPPVPSGTNDFSARSLISVIIANNAIDNKAFKIFLLFPTIAANISIGKRTINLSCVKQFKK